MNDLRKSIIEEMKRMENKTKKELGDHIDRRRYCCYCTWWFRFYVNCTTKQARNELNKMEKEGIVTSDKTQKNNTKWLLVKQGD